MKAFQPEQPAAPAGMAGVPYLEDYEVLIVLGLLSLGAAAYMTLQFLYYRDGLKSGPQVARIFQAS